MGQISHRLLSLIFSIKIELYNLLFDIGCLIAMYITLVTGRFMFRYNRVIEHLEIDLKPIKQKEATDKDEQVKPVYKK